MVNDLGEWIGRCDVSRHGSDKTSEIDALFIYAVTELTELNEAPSVDFLKFMSQDRAAKLGRWYAVVCAGPESSWWKMLYSDEH